MPPPMQATTTTRHHHARHRAQQRQYSAMFGIAVLAAALMTMAAVGPCQAQEDKPEARPCRYTQFNPWDAWNIYALKNIFFSYGSQAQGKVACAFKFEAYNAQVNTAPSTFATQPPFAVTVATYAFVETVAGVGDRAVINGGIDVQDGVLALTASTVHGDIRVGGTDANDMTLLQDAVVSGVLTSTKEPLLVSGSPPAQGTNIVESVPKTVNFANMNEYFVDLSLYYNGLPQDVAKLDVSTVLTDGIIRVELHSQVNVAQVKPEDIAAASKIILSGIPNAVLIINIDTVVAVRINKLDVVYEGARGRVGEPTFNRVLLNFPRGGTVLLGAGANIDWYMGESAHLHAQGKEQPAANHTEIEAQARAIHAEYAKRTHARVAGDDLPVEKPVMHFSVLAPASFVGVDNVIVKGNVIGANVGFTGGAEVHTRPWSRFAPPPPKQGSGGPVKPRKPRQPSKVLSNCLWGNI